MSRRRIESWWMCDTCLTGFQICYGWVIPRCLLFLPFLNRNVSGEFPKPILPLYVWRVCACMYVCVYDVLSTDWEGTVSEELYKRNYIQEAMSAPSPDLDDKILDIELILNGINLLCTCKDWLRRIIGRQRVNCGIDFHYYSQRSPSLVYLYPGVFLYHIVPWFACGTSRMWQMWYHFWS